MLTRLAFIFDRTLTCANALEKSIAAYGADEAWLRFSGDWSAYGVQGQSLTRAQLKTVVDRLSSALLAAGMRRFERIAICKRGGLDYLLISLAVIRAGGITVPINGRLPAADLQRYLAYTGASRVFVDDSTLDRLDPEALRSGALQAVTTSPLEAPVPGVLTLAALLAGATPGFQPVAIARHDDVMIVHTSGTTGFPKGVLHGSYSIIRATQGQMAIQPMTRSNKLMLASPANHHITQAAFITCIVAGVPAYVPAGETGARLLGLIEAERSNAVMAFPDIYQDLCSAGLDRFDLRSVRAWMAGGDSSHEVHIRQLVDHGAFLRVFGRRLVSSMYVEFFGTSEVGFAALMKVSTRTTSRFARCVGRRTLVSPQVKLADPQGRPVPRGQVGRLMVKGPTLFKGYWNLHSALHGVHIDGWWWTGDVMRQDEGGRYVHLDREVDVIAADGGPVYSLPVEERLLAHPAVADVAVIEVSRDGRTCAAAVIECRSGRSIGTAEAEQLLKGLGPDSQGRLVPLVLPPGEALPRGLTGKVLKRKLRERFGPEPLPLAAAA